MAHIGVDFEPALTRLPTVFCDGLTGNRSAPESAATEAGRARGAGWPEP